MNDVKKCPHCGKQLHSTAQYCMFCMTSLQPKQDITPTVPVKRRWGVPVVIVLGVLVLVLLAIFFRCGTEQIDGEVGAFSPATFPQYQTSPSVEDTAPKQPEVPQSAVPQVPPSINPVTTKPNNQQNPQITIPSATDPAEPQVPQTTPPTDPPKPVCAHYYLAATCIAPMTCTLCGDTVGTVNNQAHVWQPVTSVIHHEEVGHYEDVTVSYKKTVYLCFFCGYNQEGFDSMEQLRQHITVHTSHPTYEMIIGYPDMLTDTREAWATRIERQWVVDQKAYDETVITAYVCTVCNLEKDP